MDPCHGPTVPTTATKEAAVCRLSVPGNCYKVQERFLLIQSGVMDEYNEVIENIENLERWLEETLKTLQDQIDEDKSSFDEAQEALAAAMQKEATAGETARITAEKSETLDHDLKYWMKHCSDNYIRLEGEVCALKKIRGELYKIKGGGHSSFFQDCEVGPWNPHMCMKFGSYGDIEEATCGTGYQYLTREVLTHSEGGAKCLPLQYYRICNAHPCPVDCHLHAWTDWSKCSAECGGGVQSRLRDIEQAARNGGKTCPPSSDTRPCNTQACEKDCELSQWSSWSKCSKVCDGGTQKRTKYVKESPEGEGKCPEKWSMERLEYKKCNAFACELPDPTKAMPCKSAMDVVLLIDGSGSLGRRGWNAEIKAAETFTEAFQQSGASQMSVILYSGPRTWSGVYKCTGESSEAVDMENTCKIKTLTHFSSNIANVKSEIHKLTWPGGSTLTSLALMTAKAELTLGRKNATSVVVVITDGRPLSYRNTKIAAKNLRKQTRLVWVPVTQNAPLKEIKEWATRRWQENIVTVDTFSELEDPATATKIVGDVCPEPYGYAHWR
jgi:hypothetical protein